MNTSQLEFLLNRYINSARFAEGIGFYFIKEQVGKVRNMKIEIYANDHNPPHFHVKSNDNSINASFRLDNCELLNGEIKSKDYKLLKAFYDDQKTQHFLRGTWNKSKKDNQKI